MNRAKKLLTAGDCPRCGGRLEDLGDGEVSCDTCEYPEEPEDGGTCEVCGNGIDTGAAHVCPDCGAHLCSVECLKSHADDVHDRGVCDQCGELFDYVNLVEIEDDGTYRFCSRDCAKQWLEENP